MGLNATTSKQSPVPIARRAVQPKTQGHNPRASSHHLPRSFVQVVTALLSEPSIAGKTIRVAVLSDTIQQLVGQRHRDFHFLFDLQPVVPTTYRDVVKLRPL